MQAYLVVWLLSGHDLVHLALALEFDVMRPAAKACRLILFCAHHPF